MGLFQDCLGEAFDRLPPLVRKAHKGTVLLTGEATVERGRGVAQVICWLFGMPPSRTDCPLAVEGSHEPGVMHWRRRFDAFVMNSYFYQEGRYLVERLGAVHLVMRLTVEDAVLYYHLETARIFGVPLPKFILPEVMAMESQADEHYRFKVDVSMPLIGTLIRYWGDLHVQTIAAKRVEKSAADTLEMQE